MQKNKYLVTEKFENSNNYLNEYYINREELIILGSYGLFYTFYKYYKLLNKINPHYIFVWEIKPAIIYLVLSFFFQYKVINCSIRHGIRLWKSDHLFRSLIAWLSPYVIANSKAGLKANNLKPSKCNFILYNGIDSKLYRSKLSNQIRRNLITQLFDNSVSEKTKIFISVANLVPYKDYFTVLFAFSKIKHTFDFRYIIIGDGEMRAQVNQKIIELELTDKVSLIGRVNNVNDYLLISDYFIHSSRGEGLSNAIIEAMFTGLPIIATDVGGTKELVYEKSFSLFDYKDTEKLIGILTNLDNEFQDFDPSSIEYQNHLSKFTVETMTDNFERIIEKISANDK